MATIRDVLLTAAIPLTELFVLQVVIGIVGFSVLGGIRLFRHLFSNRDST
jgi:hypothetical protein